MYLACCAGNSKGGPVLGTESLGRDPVSETHVRLLGPEVEWEAAGDVAERSRVVRENAALSNGRWRSASANRIVFASETVCRHRGCGVRAGACCLGSVVMVR